MTKEEAIKELEEDKALYMPEEWMECVDRDTPDGRLITALDMAISALKGEWIPIEEREPDNVHERVYVTQLVPKSPCKPNGTTVYITRFIDLHEKKKYITAWQPLPKPYKKGE